MLRDDTVTNAETQASALANGLRCVERIEHLRRVLYAGAAVGKLHEEFVVQASGRNPEIAFAGVLENGVNGVVYHIQKNLLELMRVRGGHRKIGGEIEMHANIVHAQVVIAERKSIFNNLIERNRYAFRVVLPREAEQVLHDSVRALRLFIKFFRVLQSLRIHLAAGCEQLAIAENRGERIV